MLLVRAMDIPDDGRFLRNMIVEAMWNDVQTRSKKLVSIEPKKQAIEPKLSSAEKQLHYSNYYQS